MSTTTANIRCLVVDDDADDQELFAAAMEASILKNYTCIFAGDGVQAIDVLNTGLVPDYIFLDLNMPRLNGMQCLAEMRRQQHLQTVPIAIYSTSTDPSSRDQALNMGATAFISKPSKFNELISRLNEFFSSHRPQ